jgi:hypothetical protein
MKPLNPELRTPTANLVTTPLALLFVEPLKAAPPPWEQAPRKISNQLEQILVRLLACPPATVPSHHLVP